MSTSLLNQSKARGEFYKAVANGPDWTGRVALKVPTLGPNPETFSFLDSAPAASRWRGPRRTKAPSGRRIIVTREDWEASVQFGRRDMERDQTGEIRRKMAELAVRMSAVGRKLGTELIIAGTGTTLGTAYDGVAFFSASHVLGASGTQKNLLTNSEVASYNVTTPSLPTMEELADVFVDTISYMKQYKDDEGEPMHELANSWTFMTPTAWWGRGLGAMHANNFNSQRANIIQIVRERAGFDIEVIDNPRLTATDAFYTFRSDSGTHPALIICEEEMLNMAFWDEDSDFYKDNNAYKVGADGSIGAMYGEPLCCAKGTLS